MDRFLTVNDSSAGGDDFESPSDPPREPRPDVPRGIHQELPSPDDLFPPPVRVPEPQPRVHGFCLYLGPRGERCSKPALDGGFCARHQPNAQTAAAANSPQVAKRLITAIGIMALLLPILLDVLRALARWLATP